MTSENHTQPPTRPMIGQMGNTASYPIPIHLHYEVLTGEWGDQAGSFALDAVDILSYLPAN